MATLELTKHHGLGNDFLVLDARGGLGGVEPGELGELARRLCHRTRGVGADGLLVVHEHEGYAARMELINADGSSAAMSGNGIRCFAQALAMREGSTGTLRILTAAGERVVEIHETADLTTIDATVAMGSVADLDAPASWVGLGVDPGRPVAHLSLGNPHTVVGVSEIDAVDLVALGEQLSDVNLEIIEPSADPSTIVMRVHERGVGITEACGTGACAAAVAARRWGLVPDSVDEVTVQMPGGSVSVRIDDDEVYLRGPATYIGRFEVGI
jgi:diaminopimelate epimerase